MTGLETALSAAIVLCAAVGLLLASRVLEGPEKRRRHFFCYYTNLSNLLVGAFYAARLIPGPHRALLERPGIRYAAVLCILTTFLVYFLVLTRFGRRRGRDRQGLDGKGLANVLLHYAVPGLTLAEWLLSPEGTGLGLRHAVGWLAIPLGYLAFAALRSRTGKPLGKSGSLWPYGFMDRQRLGKARWRRNMLLTAGGLFALGLLFLGAARLLF